MSMYRQLWLATITAMLLALLGSLLASTLSARAYLAEQLSMKNADNAAALALSLSQRKPDPIEIELAVAALFDSGHYEAIRVTDPFGKTMVERQASSGDNGVPAWFTSLLPISSAPGTAQISDGWTQVGTIELVSHARFAYQALWKSALEMVAALGLAGLVGGFLGSLVLARLRRPLNRVIDQAHAITERRFITIDEPTVPELRSLALAMNTTVTRLKAMFDEEAQRLDLVRREAHCDAVTGLANRNHFLARLRQSLSGEESAGGSLMLVRIAHLAEVNHQLGREATDELLRSVGDTIGAFASRHPDGLAARLNGADFALLLPDVRNPRPWADQLMQEIVMAGQAGVEQFGAHCGIGHFPPGIELSALLAGIDSALASAEQLGSNAIVETQLSSDDDAPRSGEEWTRLIRQALDQKWVRLVSFPVNNLSGTLLHRECPLRLMLDEHGDWLPAGRFLPMAERLRLTSEIDLTAVTLGLEELNSNASLPGLAINLSASSIDDEHFRKELIGQLGRFPVAAKRLWLEVSDTGVYERLASFRSLIGALRGSGCRVGIEHFGRQFSQIGLIHDLGLDYVKVDASFVRGLSESKGNQAFLQGLCMIAHSIGLTVIAEGVATDAELATLVDLGFDGATGPAIK